MNMMSNASSDADRTVEFHGRWQEFLSIAFVNLLLTIVTLGIYRFWGQAKVRRYLWSRTEVLGTELEWTGTGGEMFKGFLIAVGILFGTLVAIVGVSMAVGEWFLIAGMVAFYIGMFWAIGFAQFRAMRYRLSRTYWRGIRGGSDDNGVNYGWTALGRTIAALFTLGIATPWALTRNWNDRVNAMSFGPHPLRSHMDSEGLMGRWLLIYPAYALVAFLFVRSIPDPVTGQGGTPFSPLIMVVGLILVGLVAMAFWSLYFRKCAEAFEVSELGAGFSAHTTDWVVFYLKMVGLVVVTLGLGLLVVPYFRWKFVTDHLSLYGSINVDTLTQSTTRAPGDAEGFLDALDVGAF